MNMAKATHKNGTQIVLTETGRTMRRDRGRGEWYDARLPRTFDVGRWENLAESVGYKVAGDDLVR